MKSRASGLAIHNKNKSFKRWLPFIVIPIILFFPDTGISQRHSAKKSSFFEAHLNRTLAGLEFLSPAPENLMRTQLSEQFNRLYEIQDYEIEKALQNGFLPSQLMTKQRWNVLNESEIIGIRIHQRDRDRLQPYDWQVVRRAEMERNENRQMIMLKERTGDEEDPSSLITYFEYDERGYPTRQFGYMSNGVSQLPYLDMQISYDAQGRVEQIRERYYNVMGNQRSDSVRTRFQYQDQERSSLRVENGSHGHMHSDTVRTQFQEGNENEPLRLMIYRSMMVQDGDNGQFRRERSQHRYTYPTLHTILDYMLQKTYYYDLAPFELEVYNEQTGEYEFVERLVQNIEQGFTTLQSEMWEGLDWDAGDLWYVHLNERDKPDFIEVYDQSLSTPYLFEAHEITSEFATTVDQIEQSPETILLYQNYPNPFNPQTQIIFEIAESEWVTLTVYDALGRRVTTLVDQITGAGRHEATFDARGLPTGLYYYQLQTGEQVITRTMIFLK